MEQPSSILRPALAGAMISLLGLGVSFGANAVPFLISTTMFAALARTAKRSTGSAADGSEADPD